MSLILSLNLSSVKVSLLTEWFTLKDLTFFDSSVCNSTERQLFMNLISKPILVIDSSEQMLKIITKKFNEKSVDTKITFAIFKWIKIRKIHFSTVIFMVHQHHNILGVTYYRHSMISKATNLVLSFHHQFKGTDMKILPLLQLPKLKLNKLSLEHHTISMSSMVIEKFSCLQALHVSEVEHLSVFNRNIGSLPNLTFLKVDDTVTKSSQCQLLTQFTQARVLLTELQVNFSDEIIIEAVSQLVNIKKFRTFVNNSHKLFQFFLTNGLNIMTNLLHIHFTPFPWYSRCSPVYMFNIYDPFAKKIAIKLRKIRGTELVSCTWG